VPIGPNVGPDAAPEDRTTARRALGVAPDRFVLAFFGFVHPVKGIETLLRALARAREARPDLLLWIVGGVHSLALRGDEANGYEATIRALIGELGLADIVTMTGFQPDSEGGAGLRAADLAVLPFNHGATMKSGTLVTCLSYGLPVLTTGGPEGAGLGPGSGAWVVPPRDPAALSEAILHLAADADLRRDLGRAGLSASETYGWSRIVEEHRRIYLEDRGRVSAGGASGGAPSRDDLRRHRALGPAALR
jgi:glycosyltransferase involved in cell wall biosynthesis